MTTRNAMVRRNSSAKLPPRNNNEKGSGKGKAPKGIIICTDCSHVFYRKRWISPEKMKGMHASISMKEGICPSCKMAKQHLFEGEVVVENVPASYTTELYNLVMSYARKAMDRDSQHRVLDIIQGKVFRITTSENQLALKLAQKISEVFRGLIEMAPLQHSREPYKVDRVQLAFV